MHELKPDALMSSLRVPVLFRGVWLHELLWLWKEEKMLANTVMPDKFQGDVFVSNWPIFHQHQQIPFSYFSMALQVTLG